MNPAPSINLSEFENNCFGLFYLTNQGVDAVSDVLKLLERYDIHLVRSKISDPSIFRVLYEESTSSEWFDHKIALVSETPALAVLVKGPPDTPSLLNDIKGNFDGSDIGTLRNLLMSPDRDIRQVWGFNVYNTQIHTSDQNDVVRDLSSFMNFEDIRQSFTDEAIENLFAQHSETLLIYNSNLAESIVQYLAVQTNCNRQVESVIRVSNGYFFPSGAPIHMQMINRVLSTRSNLNTFHLFYVDDPSVKTMGFRVHDDTSRVVLIEVFASDSDGGGRLFDQEGTNTRRALDYVLKNCDPNTTVGVIHIVELDQANTFSNVLTENCIPFGTMNHLSNRLVESQLSQKVLQRALLIGCVSPKSFPSQIEDKYFPLFNAVDTDFFCKSKEQNGSPRSNHLRLVHLGRFCREKGQYKTVEIFNRLVEEGHNVQLVLAGPDDDPSERNRVIDLVRQLNLESRVQVLSALNPVEVKDLLSKADLLLLPSQYDEGIPRVLLEASSMGVPFVSSGAGGASYAVTKEASVPNGIIVEANTVDGFYRELTSLLKNPASLEDMKQTGPKFIRDVFGLHKIVERHLAFLETIRLRGNAIRLCGEIDRSALLRSSSIAMPSMNWLAEELVASGYKISKVPTVEKINLDDTSYRSSVSTVLINGKRHILKGYEIQSLEQHKSQLQQYENTYSDMNKRGSLETVFPFTQYGTAENPLIDTKRDRFFSIWDFLSGRRLEKDYLWKTFGKEDLVTLGRDIGKILNEAQLETSTYDGSLFDWFDAKRVKLKNHFSELSSKELSEPMIALISDHLEILEQVDIRAQEMSNSIGRIGLVPNDLRRRNFLFDQNNVLQAVFDLSLDNVPIFSALAPTLLSFGYEANGNYRNLQFDKSTIERVACLKNGFSQSYECFDQEMRWMEIAISVLIAKRLITDLELLQVGILNEAYVLSVSRISHVFLRSLILTE